MRNTVKRNWSHYNHRLKSHSRIEVFVSQESIGTWYYKGVRAAGGKKQYSDAALEACLLVREYFKLGLRQTEGFVQSLLDMTGCGLKAPDFSTISRRCSSIVPRWERLFSAGEGLVIAIDSTGLSLHTSSSWNRKKYRPGAKHCNDQWRKLHVAIDTATGMIIAADYTRATDNDCLHLPRLIDQIEAPIVAVAGDMAYDTRPCREAIWKKGARQLIPPKANARLAGQNRKLKRYAEPLKERDDAILYIKHNSVDGDPGPAIASWKQKVGYHVRSRVETTFSQLKNHTSDKLTNRNENNRKAQALMRCAVINKLIAI